MGGDVVAGDVTIRTGVAVDEGLGQPRDLMEKSMMGVFGDGMSCSQRESTVGDDHGLSTEFVAHPSDPHRLDSLYAIDTGEH